MAYWQRWKVQVGDEANPWHSPTDWNTPVIDTVKAHSDVKVSPTLAIGLEHGSWSIRATRYFNVHGSEPFTPVWQDATTVSLRYTLY